MSSRLLKLLGLCGAFAAVAALPAAAEDEKGFTFTIDPLTLGVLSVDVDTSSAKVEEYRDLSSGFKIPKLGIFGVSADGNRTFAFRGTKLSQNDSRYQLEYGLAGKYSLFVDYNLIPHRFGNDARFIESRTAPGRYEISNSTQERLQTVLATQFAANRNVITFAFLNGLIGPTVAAGDRLDLGLRRDRTTARIEVAKDKRVSWQLNAFHENRDGTRPFGGSFGFNNIVEVPEPIDYNTSEASIIGTWGTKKGALNFGYRYSSFENNVPTLFYDNPWRATDSTDPNAYQSPGASSINGAATGFADLAPDNEVATLFTSGRFRFGGGWYAGGSVNYSKATQDDRLLPYTLNSAIRGINFNGSTFNATDVANLPQRTADREVKILSINADVGTRFAEDGSFTLRYRSYEYDNNSPRITFPGYVRFHAVWEDIARITVPYAYSQDDLTAELGWDFGSKASVAVSYALKSMDREFREIEGSDEDVIKASFDWRPTAAFTLRASAEFGDRSIDPYHVEAQEESFVEPEGVNNIPTLRKYDEAAREVDLYRLFMQWQASDAFNVSLGYTRRNDDYPKSEFGLKEDTVDMINLDLSYTPAEGSTFYLFGHVADRDVLQAARQSGATPSVRPLDDWTIAFDEGNDTYGLGWTVALSKKWKLDLSGTYTESDGMADFTATPGGLPLGSPGAGLPPRTAAQDFDNYEDFELLSARAKLDFLVSEHLTFGIWYLYEDYSADSFITAGLTNYLPGALLLAGNNGDYQANLVAVTMKLSL